MPFRITPIVLNLLILNGLVFLAWQLLGGSSTFMLEYFLLWKSDLVIARGPIAELFQPVQIVTQFFSHEEFFHILMNMFGLVLIGTALESVVGPKRFLAEYLTYGIGAGILIAFFDPSNNPVLGASGAISGLMVSFAMRFPDARMMIFPIPFPVKAIYLVGIVAAISVIQIVAELATSDSSLGGTIASDITIGSDFNIGGKISHFGHFAGMAVAFFYLQGWKKEYWNRNRRR